ncbi:MerR family transcriptional regulator [Enterococcus thailandicus]|uniref:MerR family transcriptional regulator n=1 Tax=Enterococcus thailandicus TaxID=417368 RepID=UPI0032E44958
MKTDDSTIPARKALLLEQAELMQEKITKMQEAHDYLLFKVENYEGHMRESEQKLQ